MSNTQLTASRISIPYDERYLFSNLDSVSLIFIYEVESNIVDCCRYKNIYLTHGVNSNLGFKTNKIYQKVF